MRRMGLLAKKLGTTQLFNEHGRLIGVTVLQAGPCTVTQVKEPSKDGYRAIQVGFESVSQNRLTKALQGHFKKSGGAFRHVKEFWTEDGEAYEVGQQITVELFKDGELIDVTGRSIGKGFQGGVKRWHWKGAAMTHGAMGHRKPGSIGSTTTPGRVFKGHHLPGHMGHVQVTVQNLRIMKVDAEHGRLIIEGSVPGPENQVMIVRRSVKRPGVIKAARGLQEVAVDEEEEKGAKKPAKKK